MNYLVRNRPLWFLALALFMMVAIDTPAAAFPHITIVEPPPNSTVSGKTPIIVAFALPDNDADDVTYANVFEDGRFLGTVTRKAATVWWDTTKEPNDEPAIIAVRGFTDRGVLKALDSETVTVFNQ